MIKKLLQPVRVYNSLYVFLLLSLGFFIIQGHELEHRPLVILDNVLGAMLVVAGLIKIVAVIIDTDEAYQVAFTFATISITSWTFTLAVYAGYGLIPWTRVVVYIYILASNSYMLPYLLTVRSVSRTVQETGREVQSIREQRERDRD